MGAAAETGRILREAREAAGKTLAEMGVATRINAKFLGELEEGTFASLPAIYRRTFLRTYARALDVDPDSLPADDPPEAPPVPAAAMPVRPIAAGPPVEATAAGGPGRNPFAPPSQLRTMIIVVALLLAALYFSVTWFAADPEAPANASGDPPPASVDAPARPDSLPAFSGGGPTATDSLVLRAATTESVWVHIVIDNDSTVEYTLPPGYALTLRARDNFLLAVGNPAGLSVSLNGRALDVLGSGDRPLKNVFLSRKSLTP